MKKNLVLIFVLAHALISIGSAATSSRNTTFWDSAEWSSDKVMTFPKTLGIKMNSIEKALKRCLRAGRDNCAYQNSSTIHHGVKKWSTKHNKNRIFTKIESIVQSVDHLPVREGKIYTANSTSQFYKEAKTLDSLGVKGEALSRAIQRCYKDLNHFCVVLHVNYEFNNEKYWNSNFNQYRYRTKAEAMVQGYKL